MAESTSENQLSSLHGYIRSYFLQVWRNSSPVLTPENNSEFGEDDEEEPNALDTVNSSGGFSLVGSDKLSVSYPGVSLHGHDVGVVQANRAAPTKRLVYYFEILVKNAGVKGQIAIGFTTSSFKLYRQPGWDANTCGYHGDDGLLYRGRGKGETFGSTFSTGDTVGCGINYATQQFFFTKNGDFVGAVPKDVKVPLFPTVSVHSQGEEITVNFGKDLFVFDLKAYEADHRSKQQIDIEKIVLPLDAGYGIVRSYLQHYGYEETLGLFDMACKSMVASLSFISEIGSCEDSVYALHQRRTLRQLIRSGQVDDAFAKIQEWYPEIIQDNSSITCVLLHCQKFVELVRGGKLEDAILYGRREFKKLKISSDIDDLMKDCAALLAYEQPDKSFFGYLLRDSQRELVADAVNAMILSTNPNMKKSRFGVHSSLEMMIRQLTVCFLEKRSLNANQGEAFNLHRILEPGKD